MRITIAELPPGTHLYRCADGHETLSDPGLAICGAERCRKPVEQITRARRIQEAIARLREEEHAALMLGEA